MLSKFFLNEIGKHNHVPDDQFNQEQLKIGTEIEKEHTDDAEEAKSIAKDHLSEPGMENKYYTELIKMERKIKKRKG